MSAVSALRKRAVMARDNHRCQYCGRRASWLTVDHVTPVSEGGGSRATNLVACCRECNRQRGATNIEEWCARVDKKRGHQLGTAFNRVRCQIARSLHQ